MPFRHDLMKCLILTGLLFSTHVAAHEQQSIQELVSDIRQRIISSFPPAKLTALTPEKLLTHLSTAEQTKLSSNYIQFNIDKPVTLFIIKQKTEANEPFWLYDGSFKAHHETITEAGQLYEIWYRNAPAGEVKLGIPGFRNHSSQYAIALAPTNNSVTATTGDQAHPPFSITDSHPKQMKLTPWKVGARPFTDINYQLSSEIPLLKGSFILQTPFRRSKLSRIIGQFRETDFPSSTQPDQITLTWCGLPSKSICVQWRSTAFHTNDQLIDNQKRSDNPLLDNSEFAPEGIVEFREVGTSSWMRMQATHSEMTDTSLINDPKIMLFKSKLTDLTPNTEYQYRVGHQSSELTEYQWSKQYNFSTAPENPLSFSFNYMGDAQNGLETWGKLIHQSFQRHPEARFYIMAGDLVDRGNDRDDWDHFFNFSSPIFSSHPIVPALGNHEYLDGEPELYLDYFQLPQNGPLGMTPGKAYYFNYSNALFVVLDTNIPPETQTRWLDELLNQQAQQNPPPRWKFVIFHHPIYSAVPKRNNSLIREAWKPVIEKHNVDFVLQGHDHSYMRTYPLKDGKKRSPSKGTYYVVSVSGTKMYPQIPPTVTEKAFVNIPTYQIIDIKVEGDRLSYRSFDKNAKLMDEIHITKPIHTIILDAPSEAGNP